jgi:hypothetical protein
MGKYNDWVKVKVNETLPAKNGFGTTSSKPTRQNLDPNAFFKTGKILTASFLPK